MLAFLLGPGEHGAQPAAEEADRDRHQPGEHFTRKLGDELGLEADEGSFLKQYTSVTHLVEAVGEAPVVAAYFEGDVAGLKAAADGRKAGTWKQWLDLLDANDFKGANAPMR